MDVTSRSHPSEVAQIGHPRKQRPQTVVRQPAGLPGQAVVGMVISVTSSAPSTQAPASIFAGNSHTASTSTPIAGRFPYLGRWSPARTTYYLPALGRSRPDDNNSCFMAVA